MEFVDTFGLDPNVAYTPKINDAMLDLVTTQNIDSGMSESKANEIRAERARGIKKLLAQNGMLK